jgi:uncharacterized Fe-S cluster-containing protein
MTATANVLPGLDCGSCGFRRCSEFERELANDPALLRRCIHLAPHTLNPDSPGGAPPAPLAKDEARHGKTVLRVLPENTPFVDSLGRAFDFYLEHFPEDPGPREVILPRNALATRELDIKPGDYLSGRPLGMSCGCPITHCGVVLDADQRTGVITWCITGPLHLRSGGGKDLGYYSAEAYEGLIKDTRVEAQIGGRYYFQPRCCMLQWRHSGLVNFLNRTGSGVQVRLEGLWIG